MGAGISRARKLQISLREYHRVTGRVRAILPPGIIVNADMSNRWMEVWTPDLKIAFTLQFRWLSASNGEAAGCWYINGKHVWAELERGILHNYRKVTGT